MKEKGKNPVLETADQTLKNYEQALRAGLKFQEETLQSWGSMLNQNTCQQEWQKGVTNATAAVSGILPAVQKRMEESVELMEKNARLSADLMKKAAEATQTPTIAESQSKWTEFAKASLEAAQFNVEAVMQINSRAIDSFLGFVQKNSALVQQREAKAA
jgi:hypothetical protein